MAKCKGCNLEVTRMASKCQHCGEKSPGVTAGQYLFAYGFLAVAVVFIIAAPSENVGSMQKHEVVEDHVAEVNALAELAKAATGAMPANAYVVEGTAYAHFEFETDGMYVDAQLLKIKRLLPELLKKYPNVDRFFFGFKTEGPFYMKVNARRSQVSGVMWDRLMVRDMPELFEEYWLLPALRN